MWLEKKVCSIRNATSEIHREKYALPGGLHLQYEVKVMQYS